MAKKNSEDKSNSGKNKPLNYKGALRLRGDQINPKDSTYDARLLNTSKENDWLHSDPWRVLRIQSEFVEGFGSLAEIGKAVTVFGSARTKIDSQEYKLGVKLGEELAKSGYAVITGGGPGAMEAANKGASKAGGLSIGLGIELPQEVGLNDWVDLGVNFRYFFVRKTMFVKYSQAFVCLPGGMGTMDELFEAVTLVQTKKISKFPIILLGKNYWSGLIEWIENTMVTNGKVGLDESHIIQCVDTVDEVLKIISEFHSGLHKDKFSGGHPE